MMMMILELPKDKQVKMEKIACSNESMKMALEFMTYFK